MLTIESSTYQIEIRCLGLLDPSLITKELKQGVTILYYYLQNEMLSLQKYKRD